MCASSAVSSSFSFEYASLRYCTSLASLSVLAMTSLFCRIDEASGYPGGGLASPPPVGATVVPDRRRLAARKPGRPAPVGNPRRAVMAKRDKDLFETLRAR